MPHRSKIPKYYLSHEHYCSVCRKMRSSKFHAQHLHRSVAPSDNICRSCRSREQQHNIDSSPSMTVYHYHIFLDSYEQLPHHLQKLSLVAQNSMKKVEYTVVELPAENIAQKPPHVNYMRKPSRLYWPNISLTKSAVKTLSWLSITNWSTVSPAFVKLSGIRPTKRGVEPWVNI